MTCLYSPMQKIKKINIWDTKVFKHERKRINNDHDEMFWYWLSQQWSGQWCQVNYVWVFPDKSWQWQSLALLIPRLSRLVGGGIRPWERGCAHVFHFTWLIRSDDPKLHKNESEPGNEVVPTLSNSAAALQRLESKMASEKFFPGRQKETN